MLEILSRNLEKIVQNKNKATKKEEQMNDVDYAYALLEEVVGDRGKRESVGGFLERVYVALSKRSSQWTRRRVKSLWYREVSRIERREIADMKAIIKARIDHENYKQETATLIAVAVARTPTENGGVNTYQGGKDCRVDSTRDSRGNGGRE